MGMTLGDLLIKIGVDQTEVDDAIADSKGKGKTLADNLSGALGGAVKIGMTAAAGGVVAIGGAIAGSITAANDWAGRLDSLGDVLGTNAEDSAALAVAINGVGGNVEQITGQMAKMSQGLADAKGNLGPAGNLLKELGISAFQGKDGIIDLQTAIEPKRYAELIEGVEDSEDKLKKLKTAFENAKNPTKEMSDAIALQEMLTRDWQKALDDAQGKVVNFNEVGLRPSVEVLQEVATKIAAMPDGLEKTKLQMELFGKSGKDMTDVMSALAGDGFDKASQKAKEMGLSMSDEAVAASVEMGKKMKDLEMSLQGVAVKIGGELLPVILPLLEQFLKFAQDVLPKVATALKPMMDALINVAKELMPQVQLAFEKVSAWLEANWPAIQVIITDVFTAIGVIWTSVLQPVLSVLLETLGKIVSEIAVRWPEIKKVIGDVFSNVKFLWDTVLRPVLGFIIQIVGDTIKRWVESFNEAKAVTETVFAAIDAIYNAVLKPMFDKIITDVTAVISFITTNWPKIEAVIRTVMETVQKVINVITAAIRGDWEGAWNGIKDIVMGVWQNILGFFEEMWPKFADFGKRMIDGLISGIRSMGESFKQELYKIIPGPIRDILGIASPSKFMIGIGKNMMEGLAIGLKENSKLPNLALSNALPGGLAGSMPGVMRSPANTFNIYATMNNGMDADMLAYKIARRLT